MAIPRAAAAAAAAAAARRRQRQRKRKRKTLQADGRTKGRASAPACGTMQTHRNTAGTDPTTRSTKATNDALGMAISLTVCLSTLSCVRGLMTWHSMKKSPMQQHPQTKVTARMVMSTRGTLDPVAHTHPLRQSLTHTHART